MIPTPVKFALAAGAGALVGGFVVPWSCSKSKKKFRWSGVVFGAMGSTLLYAIGREDSVSMGPGT